MLKSEPGRVPVAVFGVVDPSLLQKVGRYNSIWLEELPGEKGFTVDNHYETDLQVADPAEALKQVLDYCIQDPDCASARKILLAQMPQQTVYQMLASFHGAGFHFHNTGLRAAAITEPTDFDLVIAEADPERGTGNRTTVKTSDTERREFVVSTKHSRRANEDRWRPDALRPAPTGQVEREKSRDRHRS